MDDAAADTICKRAMVELVFLLAHQRNPRSRQRRDDHFHPRSAGDGLMDRV